MNKKILASILAATIITASSVIMVSAEGNVAPVNTESGKIEHFGFHRAYTTTINNDSYTEVMYDSNTWADDTVTIFLGNQAKYGSAGHGSVTYRLTEIMAFGDHKETFKTLSAGETTKITIKKGNNFRIAAKGATCTITTYVTLGTV